MSVIFNRVPDSERYRKTSLDELIDYLTNEKIDAIDIIKSQIINNLASIKDNIFL